MRINAIDGDLIKLYDNGHFNVVGHGCNCIHAMKNGIAKTFVEYTSGKIADADRTSVYGDVNKMGEYTVLPFKHGLIYNLYTQFIPAYKNTTAVHWQSVRNALQSSIVDAKQRLPNSEINYGIPLIGCGLAGGKVEALLDVIESLENEIDDSVTLTIVNFVKS